MQIIYVSDYCEKEYFDMFFLDNKKVPNIAIQKYHRLLVNGFSNNGVKVSTISSLPISQNNCSKKFIRKKIILDKGITYNHLSVFNLIIFKNIWTLILSFINTIKLSKKDKSIVVCDALNLPAATGALLASKIFKIKSVAIVTDLPEHVLTNKRIISVNNKLINRFDSYILLTKEMINKININNKKNIVIEGFVDINMSDVENDFKLKTKKKIVIYAGCTHKKYGIDYLVDAFIAANVEDSELHIYGSGDYDENLKKIAKEYTNIKLQGMVNNDIVVIKEIEATLLVNPRPTNQEFTKYSFPSKNMEYMASGTPVLTTNLSGMPEEYLEFVYIIDDETTEGLCEKIKFILQKDKNSLHDFGMSAKSFIIKNKSNTDQAKKILEALV